MNANELRDKQLDVDARLIELNQAAGMATLAGKKFDFAEIERLERERAALQSAEAIKSQRDREAADAARQAALKTKRAQLKSLLDTRQADVKEAEFACRSLAAALTRVFATNAEMAKVTYELTGQRAPAPLTETDLESRLADYLSAVMSSVQGHKFRLGSHNWRHRFAPDYSWTDAQQKLMLAHIEPLTKEGK